jgi:hypothetical protein
MVLIFGLPNLGENGKGGRIEITPLEYDFGAVSISAGLVKKTYEIKNAGEGDLKINDILTSCGCTKAVLKIGDRVSPEFTMPGHGINPAAWSETLKPGEKGELEVVFDPAFHGPQGKGEVVRVIYLSTNDSQNKKAEVKLSGRVTK